MGKFQKGNPGRPKGTQNKLTRTVRDTVLAAFNELQDDPKANIVAWAKKQPGLFYQIAAKLIPTEINATLSEKIIVVEIQEDESNSTSLEENN